MAIKNPRVAVTISEETKRLYERAGALMGISTSKYIASILTEASPAVEAFIAAIEEKGTPVETLVKLTALVRDQSSDIQADLIDEIAAKKGRK